MRECPDLALVSRFSPVDEAKQYLVNILAMKTYGRIIGQALMAKAICSLLSWKKLHVPLVLIISQLRIIEN